MLYFEIHIPGGPGRIRTYDPADIISIPVGLHFLILLYEM